ncbi:MAG TPA: prepilin-type N-terminal cleavage/methylation domain-containing protein [Gemmatimonadales bacterium]|jgi:prepilin-type N-terminal cleavage/methylation domain-containing protein
MRTNKGFTLVELLVAMVVFVVVLAAAMSFLVAQSKTFRRGSDDMGVIQNMSFGADNLDSQLRTAGSNTVDNQPVAVYAGNNTFAFNSNYVSNDTTDIFAVYFDPDAPAAQVEALRLANQIAVPGSSPAWNYPSLDYQTTAGTTSTAELITLYFTPDLETSRTDDYTLMRQVNNNAPETLVRQVLPDSTNLPFFRYYMIRPPAANQMTQLTLVPAAQLPLKHTFATHGDGADTTRIDSLRAVLVSYVITNGQTGTLERTQRISLNIPLPNMGMKQLKICGSEPIMGAGLNAVWQPLTGKMRLTWLPAFDENSGEKDVVRYVIWKKKTTDPSWTDPLTSVAAGQANYTYDDNSGFQSGASYEYRLAAQDCSPKLSTQVSAFPPAIP